MKKSPPLCAVCRKLLPPNRSNNRKYCSASCREKAKYRMRTNRPIADPIDKSTELQEQLAVALHRNQRLERLVKRQRQINARNRSRALDAKDAVATARRQKGRIEHRINKSVEGRISAYLERIAALEIEAETLRKRNAQAQQHIQELQFAHQFAIDQSQHFKKEMKTAASAITKLKASLSAPSAIFVDYRYFARWYFQKKPKREWDDHDYNRLQRLNTYVKSASTAQQARNLRQGQKPKARVRMNRFQ